MDADAKKTVLRHFPYGLYVVTVAHNGEEHAMTANWVTQTAFEPPMIAVAVENTSKTIGMIRDAHYFAVSLLTSGQRELAGKLGRSSEQAPQKLKGIKTKPAPASKIPCWPRHSAGSNAGRSPRCRPGTTRWCWVKSWTPAWKVPTHSR